MTGKEEKELEIKTGYKVVNKVRYLGITITKTQLNKMRRRKGKKLRKI